MGASHSGLKRITKMEVNSTRPDVLCHALIMNAATQVKEQLNDPNLDVIKFKSSVDAVKSLCQLLKALDGFIDASEATETQEKCLSDIVKDIFFPMVYSIHLLPDSDKANSEMGKTLSLLKNLSVVCCRHLGDAHLPIVASQLVVPLFNVLGMPDTSIQSMKRKEFHQRASSDTPLNQFLSLEVLDALLSDTDLSKRYLAAVGNFGVDAGQLLQMLFKGCCMCQENDSAFSKAFIVAAKLLDHFTEDLKEKHCLPVWMAFTKTPVFMSGEAGISKHNLWRSLYVLYCLKNFFFPLEENKMEDLADRLRIESFWIIVQAGLVSCEPLHRKLSLYLLKRLIDTCETHRCAVNSDEELEDLEDSPLFWWSSAEGTTLSKVWEDFILLFEVLEEKQVHVVKPLLPKMKNLIKAASTMTKSGLPLFHSSWLVTIITRCFDHDSHFMSRWGAHTLLTVDFETTPLIQHGQLKFLSHNLINHLQENKLYSRYESTEIGTSSPVASAMRSFFKNLFSCLDTEQKVKYLDNLLRIVCENSWGSIPLVFVFEGLGHIPPQPIIGSDLLQLIRQITQSCLTTHEAVTRGAIQCFICHMLINLVDVDNVSMKEVVRTLACLNRDESMQRGTHLWSSVVSWINKHVQKDKWQDKEAFSLALEFLKETRNETSASVEGYRVKAKARMLMLYADVAEANPINQAGGDSTSTEKDTFKLIEQSCLGQAMSEVSTILAGTSARAYLDVGQINRALSLLFSLSKEAVGCTDSVVNRFFRRSIAQNFVNVSNFVKSQLLQSLIKAEDMDQVQLYCDVLLAIGLGSDQLEMHVLNDLLTFINNIFNKSKEVSAEQDVECIDILVTSSTMLLSSLCQLIEARLTSEENPEQTPHMSNSSLCQALEACVTSLKKVPQPFSRKSSRSEKTSRANVGECISLYISSKWCCYRFLYTLCQDDTRQIDVTQAIEDAMDDLSIGSGGSDTAVYQALVVVMGEIVSKVDGEKVSKLLELSWSKVMEEKKNRLFWEKLEALVPLALDTAVLRQDPSSLVGESLDKFLEKLSNLGEDKTGVLYLAYTTLCNERLTKQNDVDRQLATRLIPFLFGGCITGQLHKKGERLWLDVCAYIESLGDDCSANQIISSMSKNDVFTRIAVINWLSKLRPEDDCDRQFAHAFLEHLLEKYVDLAQKTTYKQFSNSLSHRQKHRMVLVFVLMAEFITEYLCEKYMKLLWYALEIECHPSVRQNLEWLVLILMRKYPKCVSTTWEVVKQYSTRRSVCLCSVFLILSLVGPELPKDMQSGYFEQAFTTVLPWCMAHHYNTRIFAQTTLVKLWQQCRDLKLDNILQQFAVVHTTVDFFYSNGNASATVLKLMENYMFKSFDSKADYSMETLFKTLPKLACLADDEWISPAHFTCFDKDIQSDTSRLLPFNNSTDKLAQCTPGPWRNKAQHENEEEISESADGCTGDVQKKIMPWRQMSPDQDTEMELAAVASQKKRVAPDGGLVLVTSLIDKVPNLGGLCRTSEIFGVSEFVIGNLTYLQDRMFQSLSVSAQKWVNITEVMRPRVSEYLEEKRGEGYTLVGVEQTANSVSLEQYSFPKKTLLLLGNEKEGIPVDVIQQLDVCVEVPQLGIIRSLNVHVCGALFVWEYTRQHIEQQQQQQT